MALQGLYRGFQLPGIFFPARFRFAAQQAPEGPCVGQAAEQRLLEQKAEAQRAARALAEQARRDGDGLVREAQNAVKVLENEAMQRAGEAGQAADAALRSDAERTCTAIRQQAEQRMDTAVRAIVEKVVKR